MPKILAGELVLSSNPADQGSYYHEMAESLKARVQTWVELGLTPVSERLEDIPNDWRSAPQRRRESKGSG